MSRAVGSVGVVRLVANYVLVGACVSSFWYYSCTLLHL